MATRKKNDNTILILLGGAALLLFALNKKGSLSPTPATPQPETNPNELNPADLPPLPEIPVASILPTQQEYLQNLNDSGTLTVKNPAMFQATPQPYVQNDYLVTGGGSPGVKQAFLSPDGVKYADGWDPNANYQY